jgi:tRNA(Ile)-lysidine synthase
VRRFIRDHGLVRAGDRLLAGVSGGPDSTCLLLTLAALRRSLGFTLHAAYFDHRLRGPRATAREERFVRSLTEALGVPLECGAGEVRAHARAHKRSLEEAARETRYGFLAQAARDAGCQAVAVGHTRDDQAETLLLHLLRGSGLRGLAAMAPSTPWPVAGSEEAPRLVRPLLCLSREDTEASCREAGLVPLQDPSNRSRAHLRNRIRGELLPLLRRYNPRVDEALVRLADAAAADIEVLETLAAGALAIEPASPGSRGSAGPGAVRLARRELAALPPALQHHAVRLAVAQLLGDARGLAERHVRSILRASEGPTGARLDLPRGLRAEVERRATVLSKEAPAVEPALPEGEVPLPVPGDARLGPWRVRAEVLSRPPADLSSPHDPCDAFLDADACGDRLWLRRRRRGDRFHPLGLPQPKKLQDFFVDAHVPRDARNALPLLCGELGIAWVVTQRPAEWAKVTATTSGVLHLRAARRNP